MNTLLQDVIDFHVKFGLGYDGKPRLLDEDFTRFRHQRLVSEADEYADSALSVDHSDPADYTYALEGILDALVDSIYIAMGNVVIHGLTQQFEEAWRRVHQANMAKERVTRPGESKFGSIYDIVKPAGWLPPNHVDLVEDHAGPKP